MRLKRIQNDFRVFEVLNEDSDLMGEGAWHLYRVTKRGLTTHEVVDLLAKEAGVERTAVAYAGLKDKDGITGQFMTVEGGRMVSFKDATTTIRPIGKATRALQSSDNTANSFEIILRDLSGDDMRRIRVHIDEVKRFGVPAYFDDQRFGCLRHGQGFVARKILKDDFEGALRDLLAAPSPFGSEMIERFKHGIAKRWGRWEELCDYCRDRRGYSVFQHLREHGSDFRGALEIGIASRERTIHLFAYQSHLWNRAASLWIRERLSDSQISWLPGDAGSMAVFRSMEAEELAGLKQLELPLFGQGMILSETAQRLYEAVFRAEGVRAEKFLNLDVAGFRPLGESRPLLLYPDFLRAAPAERDDIYKKRHKMRLRFTLPRGQYATLLAKRLVMPTEYPEPETEGINANGKKIIARIPKPMELWISRHCLQFPDRDGFLPVRKSTRAPASEPTESADGRERSNRSPSSRGPTRSGGKPGRGGKPGGQREGRGQAFSKKTAKRSYRKRDS